MKPSITAIHEAAHAVIARLRGIDVSTVSIRLGEGYQGRTGHEPTCSRAKFEDEPACEIDGAAEDEILMSFAGYEAEVRLRPASKQRARRGSEGDNDQAAALMEKHGVSDEQPFRRKVRAMIAQSWSTIVLVALELDKWKTLDHEELDEIINLAEGNNATGAVTCLVNLRMSSSRIEWKKHATEVRRLQRLAARVASLNVTSAKG